MASNKTNATQFALLASFLDMEAKELPLIKVQCRDKWGQLVASATKAQEGMGAIAFQVTALGGDGGARVRRHHAWSCS